MDVLSLNMKKSESLPWKESPFPGVSQKFLRIGQQASGVVDLTRIAKGAALPPHRHLVAQQAYVLAGLGEALDGTRMEVGSYAEVPAGVRHGTKAIEEVVMLNYFDGIVTWILDNGDFHVLREDGNVVLLGTMGGLGTKNLF